MKWQKISAETEENSIFEGLRATGSISVTSQQTDKWDLCIFQPQPLPRGPQQSYHTSSTGEDWRGGRGTFQQGWDSAGLALSAAGLALAATVWQE